MRYNLNMMATITGLTTRTLRNYIHMGLLQGEKIDGAWSFTEEELNQFLSDVNVKKAMESKRNALVHDFIADTHKKTNRICMVLDFPVAEEEAAEIAEFFGKTICEIGKDIEFKYVNERQLARVILSGAEEQVLDVIRKYYNF